MEDYIYIYFFSSFYLIKRSQVSQPRCMEKEAGLVEETYCAALEKPEEKSRACNKQSCPPRYYKKLFRMMSRNSRIPYFPPRHDVYLRL